MSRILDSDTAIRKRSLIEDYLIQEMSYESSEEDVDNVEAEIMYDSDEHIEYAAKISEFESSDNEDDTEERMVRSKRLKKTESGSVSRDATNVQNEYMIKFEKVSIKGKNGYIWATQPKYPRVAITPSLSTGPSEAAKLADDPKSCFELFLDDNFVDIIVKWTNEHISAQTISYGKILTTRNEIKALLGILIFSASHRDNHLTTADLWSTTGSPLYRAAMSERRFSYLLNCLRFDDSATREVRKQSDKFAPIRDLWDIFTNKCQENYSPAQYITVGEHLCGFRGKCGFKMYIPNKQSKHGIKLLIACDVESKYMLSAIPYLGKDTPPPVNTSLGHHFIKELTRKYHQSFRNITANNWFTTVPLAVDLLKNCGLTFVGAIRANKPDIPTEMIEKTRRNPLSSAFCYDQDITLVSFMPKTGNKLVNIVSTMHDQPMIAENGEPDIVITYNKTKSGVDMFDRICASYSCYRKTKWWPLCVFYFMLNAATINSWIIHKSNKQQAVIKQYYMKSLAVALVKPWAEQRILAPGLSRNLINIITSVCGVKPPTFVPETANVPVKRCSICDSSKDRKTRKICAICQAYICLQHAVLICPDCL